MNPELTRLMTFASKEEMAKSIACSESSLPVSAFLSGFVRFLKENRLDDIERIAAEGKLESYFPRFESTGEPLKSWDEIERVESDQVTQERYDRYLAGS